MAVISRHLAARIGSVGAGALLLLCVLREVRRLRGNGAETEPGPAHKNNKVGKKGGTGVDKAFFLRLYRILKIIVPGMFCKESGYLLFVAAMLVSRTYCDVWMIHNATLVESAIVGRSEEDFRMYLLNFVAAMPFISLINNLLKLGLNELKLLFRVRLTKHLCDKYMKGYTYYKIGNLDNRIANADQLLTQDVEKFCNSVVDLYSNLCKVISDRSSFVFEELTSHGTWLSLQGPMIMIAYLLLSGLLLTKLRRPIGKMTVIEQRYEGEYRYVNSRLITNRFTSRITELMMVLKDLNSGKYERTMVSHQNKGMLESDASEKICLVPGSGQIINADRIIKFEHTPLVTPNGDILIQDLTFEVKSGANVLVCGPNGCGKSSLFRLLGELWPLFGGRLVKPERGKLFYVPQRPYMTLGTLRDQVIYPDTPGDQQRKGISDQVLKAYLDNVQLGHILDREGSWDAVEDWMDILSGGEKQRMAMARLFYHKPQFAILDECTSAVSVDVEDFIYSHCRTVGITLFTVSHRKSLWKHHEYYLHMDGRGNYEFKPITSETVEFGS
uniref:ATP-binding cassette, sub-family D (ALD), member 3a n=1 Tax=Scleropages formosus TaxID=113540 RepID=A0A8C9U3A9_SCLFO